MTNGSTRDCLLSFFQHFLSISIKVSQLELSVVPPNPIGVPLYDKDKQTWELEPDMHGDTLKMRLVFKDAKHVPRNHIR